MSLQLNQLYQQSKHQAERLNQYTWHQLKELPLWEEGLPKVTLPNKNHSRVRWLALLGGILLVGIGVNGLYRIYKKNKANRYDDTRFDFFDEFAQEMNQGFDFDHASLDELEEALLKAEKELSIHLQGK